MTTAMHGHHRTASQLAARAIFWLPLILCGLVAAILTARRSVGIAHPLPRFRVLHSRRRRSSMRLQQLRSAIIGNEQSVIEQILGPAPTIADSEQGVMWYYPLDRALRRIVVIEFSGRVACDAQFIDAPRRGRATGRTVYLQARSA